MVIVRRSSLDAARAVELAAARLQQALAHCAR